MQWTRQRIRALKDERDTLNLQNMPATAPPQIDIPRALSVRKQLDKVLVAGSAEEKKALLRECVETIILHPEDYKVEIRYQIPGLPHQMTNPGTYSTGVHCHTFGSGGGFAPAIFGL